MYAKEFKKMVWSFSRCRTFEMCPYKFYLIYIEKVEKEKKFYSTFGKFIHYILEQYYKRNFTEQECIEYYIEYFDYEVEGKIKESTRGNFFEFGLSFFETLEWTLQKYIILGIEKEIHFKINKLNFIGFIDLLLQDKITKEIIVLDHKTAEYPIGKRGDVLKNKKDDYDNYKKQLYMYSVPVYEEYGQYPSYLMWNYIRSKQELKLPFIMSEFEETKIWINDLIHRIMLEKKFDANQNYANCVMLCDVSHECEYNNSAIEE